MRPIATMGHRRCEACATDTRELYQSADQMCADLELLRAGRSVKRRQAWQKSRRQLVRLGVAAAIAVAGYLESSSVRRAPPATNNPTTELLRTRGTTSQEAYNAYQMGRFYYAKQNQR